MTDRSNARRVRKHRDSRRASGLRLVQVWIPDARTPGFAEECRRQTALAAASDRAAADLGGFIDAALEDFGTSKCGGT